MPETITSPSNPKIKRLLALQQKSSARREAGLFIVEGRRELQHCIDAGFEIDSVFYCPSRCGDAPLQNFAQSAHPSQPGGWAPPGYEATGGYGFAGQNAAPFGSDSDRSGGAGGGLQRREIRRLRIGIARLLTLEDPDPAAIIHVVAARPDHPVAEQQVVIGRVLEIQVTPVAAVPQPLGHERAQLLFGHTETLKTLHSDALCSK